MAGRALRLYHDHKGVLVAVGGDGYDVLVIAAGFPFEPQLITGAAPKAGQLLFHGNLEALLVHISKGQDTLGNSIYNDSRDQTLFVKFQFVNLDHVRILLTVWLEYLLWPFVLLSRIWRLRRSGKWRLQDRHLPSGGAETG